jgi:hypothetical protein
MFFFGFLDWVLVGLLVFVLVKLSSLSTRIKDLEQGKKPTVQSTSMEERNEIKSITSSSVHQSFAQSPNAALSPSSVEKFFQWYAHEWMLKTGALFILLGFIWFATYAFLNNWIGPVGRITIGILAGAAVLLYGHLRLGKVRTQGITLVWLGAGILTVTIYAAQYYYQMFSPTVALIFLGLNAALTAIISMRHSSLSLAVAALVVGGLAPLLIGSSEKSIFGLYSYLSVVVVGTIWIARHRKWEILTFLALILTTLYSVNYFFYGVVVNSGLMLPSELITLKFFAVFLTTVFFLVNVVSIITNKSVSSVDLLTAGAIGLYTYGWINGVSGTETRGLVSAMAAILYSMASFATYTKTNLKQPVYLYTAIAVILLAISTAYEFNGPVLVMAFSLQALVLPIIGVKLLGADIGKYILFYYVLPIMLSLEALMTSWQQGIFHNDFYTITIVTFCLMASGLVFYYSNKEEERKILHDPSVWLIITGGVYGLLWIWKVFHSLFETGYIATMATLVIYTGIGLYAYLTGEVQKRTVLHKFGLSTLIFVIGRLLLIDVWTMELTWRILTFFMVGILLVASVLLGRQKTTKL